MYLGWLVTNVGALRWLKNGLFEATERWVGLDPSLFSRGEVAIAPLVIVTRCPNEAVSIASCNCQTWDLLQSSLKVIEVLGVALRFLTNKCATQVNVSRLEDRRSLE